MLATSWLLLGKGHLMQWRFGASGRRIAGLPLPTGQGAAVRQTGRRKNAGRGVYEESFEMTQSQVCSYLEEAEEIRSWVVEFARDRKNERNGANGGGRMHNRCWPGWQKGNLG